MEDILASIRRIIADDQTRHVPSSSRRQSAPVISTPAAPLVSDAPKSFNRLPDPDRGAPGSITEPAAAASSHEPGLTAMVPVDGPDKDVDAAATDTLAPAQDEPTDHGREFEVIAEIAQAGVASILGPRPVAEEVSAPSVTEAPDELVVQANVAAGVTVDLPAPPAESDPPLAEVTPDPRSAAQDVEPLVSASTGASIESSFQALATTVFMQNTAAIEPMMRDMLRPMLKTWLDDNLPTIVERLVRVEIERVARGGRA